MTEMYGAYASLDEMNKEVHQVTVEEYLRKVIYDPDNAYLPTEFALKFVTFIKLINGERGEENETPVMHYKMLDTLVESKDHVCNMCFRGSAKTTLMAEYLFLYLAVYGELPHLGKVDYALYVADSIENNVKKMRLRLERRWEKSTFLQYYLPKTRFTDIRWYFKNRAGDELVVTGHGAKTGVRGTVELNTRPQLAILDDLLSDEDAKSPTIIASIEDTVYKAIEYALHPTRNKVIWSGTPFNAKDPLYKAVESGAWAVNVFPLCEDFPVPKKEYKGAWEDRFPWEYAMDRYSKSLKTGKIHTFNQEMMLRIMSDEDRLIEDHDIIWYNRKKVLENKQAYNFYITTDFATTERSSGDFSVISVWAYSNNGDWLWVDGICKRQLMNQNVDDLFRLVVEYRPQSVGVEVSGQQGGFIPWIRGEMITRNIMFTLASEHNKGQPGIRPNTNKFQRFMVVVPWFKTQKIWFPKELRNSAPMREAVEELSLASVTGFKSKRDDFIDGVSMLGMIKAWKPSQVTPNPQTGSPYWDADWEDDDNSRQTLDSYVV